MNKKNMFKSIFVGALVLGAFAGCGSKSSESAPEAGPQAGKVYRRSYSFDDFGCIAANQVTGATQAEADRKICEAAADDAQNNFCAGHWRDQFLAENCDIRRPKPAPVTPTPKPKGPQPWDARDVSDFDSYMREVTLRSFVVTNASGEAKLVARRIATCGLSSHGSECLDAKDLFGEFELFSDDTSHAIRFAVNATDAIYLLRIVGANQLSLILNGEVVATIAAEKKRPQFPEFFVDYVDFYHSAKRALDQARRDAERDSGLMCERCADLREMQKQLKDVLNQRLGLIAGQANAAYEEGILSLAFRNSLKVEDLDPLIEALAKKSAVSGFGKALVLYAHPDRGELKSAVIDWIETSVGPDRGIGMAALGKTELSREEESFVFSWVTGDPSIWPEAQKIVRRMKLTDGHIRDILRYAPLDLEVELLLKLGTVKAIGELARIAAGRDAGLFRVAAARGLHRMKYISSDIEVRRAASEAIERLKRTVKDEAILKALDGE